MDNNEFVSGNHRWIDYDVDGDMDLFLISPNGFENPSVPYQGYVMYRNDGSGGFDALTDIGILPKDDPAEVAWGDFNNDGYPDIFCSNYSYNTIGFSDLGLNRLYKNKGDGTFEIVDNTGIADFSYAESIIWEDINNDGLLDLIQVGFYLGSLSFGDTERNLFYLNNGDDTFTLLEDEYAVEGRINGLSVSVADINKDGYVDLFIGTGDEDDLLLENSHSGNNFINISLNGVASNSFGFGARVIVKASGVLQFRQLTTTDSQWGQNAPQLHFGLNQTSKVDSIIVYWPSGAVQKLTNIASNQFITIYEEGANTFSGLVFNDTNANGTQDSGELGLRNQKVMLLPDSCFTLTNSNGGFRFTVPDGDYELKVVSDENWAQTSEPASYDLSFPADNGNSSYSFGLELTNAFYELESSLTSSPTRCGFTVPFWLTYQNKGTLSADGKLKLLPDEKATFVSSSQTATMSGDTLVWDFSNLQPSERKQIRLQFEMPGEESTGDSVMFLHLVEAIDNGSIVFNATDTLSSEILCAYDPNDKTATPFGILDEHYTLKANPIEYRIRFQNVGNASAINIVIRDTIQQEFDLNSFEVISASHEMRTQVEVQDRALAFYFDDINLADSVSNEPESHGFIHFRIKPKSGLADNTVVNNQAHIYFDFNSPILTNITKNTLVDVLPVDKVQGTDFDDISNSISLFPNPNNGNEVFIRLENELKGNFQIILTDLAGKQIRNKSVAYRSGNENVSLNISDLNQGMYFIQIIRGQQRAVKKLIRQ